MIRVNKLHSVQYRNGYFTLRTHGVTEKGKESIKSNKTYPSLEAMILQCGFDMGYSYSDAALKSKAEYEDDWNKSHLANKERAIAKKELANEKAQ